MDNAPVAVTQHLHFDMTAAGDETLEIDASIAESRARLGRRQLQSRRQILQPVHPLHSRVRLLHPPP